MSKFNFEKGDIEGYLIVERDAFDDHRGSFSRIYSKPIFSANSNFKNIENINMSINPKKHTLRGFHYSEEDANEVKIFTCISGSIFNVSIDVRPESSTYKKIKIIELSSDQKLSIIVPAGCANAWLTTEANTQILYLVSSDYQVTQERGFRFDDPSFCVDWPANPQRISEKDLNWKFFE